MRQVAKRVRVRQLADSVWPGRTVDGYANLIATRLRKLADERSTGMLPVTGNGDGVIFFRDGQVVYAESGRTPSPAHRTTGMAAFALTAGGGAAPPGEDLPRQGRIATARSVSRLAGTLELTELIVDALRELLSSESRYAKFRPSEVSPAGQEHPVGVEALLTEVQRRHEVQRQLAAVITPDSVLTVRASIGSPSAQVSPTQWELLMRAADGATPRGLAMQLGWSVFGTTIEAYRLVQLGLLAVPADGPAGARPAASLSFIRAVSGERGNDAQRTRAE